RAGAGAGAPAATVAAAVGRDRLAGPCPRAGAGHRPRVRPRAPAGMVLRRPARTHGARGRGRGPGPDVPHPGGGGGMSAQSPPAPTAAERARAHAMVDGDERRARIAWSRVLEPRRERPGLPLTRLEVALHEIGYTTAWHRLVDGDLPRAESARAHVPAVDVDAELSRVTRSGARVIVPGDADWPTALDHPLIRPHLIHVRGQGCLADLTQRAVAVVGSRAGTGYGEAVARELGSGIARSGWTVDSGAAFGIDAAAHQGGLVVDGPGVAVLPCGPDRTYPVSNHRLVDAVAESGAVVTELATGTVARRHRFLARNRLIAALSRCCIVVEAGLRSGSLNTAGWAEA